MAFINHRNRTVQTKIVYYGPGMCGKTTNLQYIFDKFHSQIQSEMISIKTHGDRTIYFDFLPFDIGKIMGYDIKIQLYTVPGQIKYNATRRLVLQGVDGVVFVADSTLPQRKENLKSLKNLQENLMVYKKNIFTTPLVFQYNKRDLGKNDVDLIPVDVMDRDLNKKLKAPFFPGSALEGLNVVKTLKKAIAITIASLQKDIQYGG